jgi:hypothetical protein
MQKQPGALHGALIYLTFLALTGSAWGGVTGRIEPLPGYSAAGHLGLGPTTSVTPGGPSLPLYSNRGGQFSILLKTNASTKATANGSSGLFAKTLIPGSSPVGSNSSIVVIIPAMRNARFSCQTKRRASLSLITLMRRERPADGLRIIPSLSTCSFVTRRSASLSSSRARSRFASAASCSARAARSRVFEISMSASASACRAYLAMSPAKTTSAKTPTITSTPPITPWRGHLCSLTAARISGPYSSSKPRTTMIPAHASSTSNNTMRLSSSFLSFVGPFIRPRRRGRTASAWRWQLLVFVSGLLLWFLFTR